MTITKLFGRARRYGAALAVSGALVAPSAMAQDLTLGGGAIGGTWNLINNAMADYLANDIEGVRTTSIAGGGVKNILGLGMGQLQIGIAYSSTAGEAMQGAGAFEGRPLDVAAIAGLYQAGWQATTRADSGIETIEDLRGKRIAPGIKGFTGETIARMVFDVYGMSYDDMARVELIGYNDAVAQIKDGHMDAFMPIAADPTASIQDLASSTGGVNILPIPDDKLAAIREINPGYTRYIIEGGTYEGQPNDVPVVGTNTVIYVDPTMDDALVQQIMEVFADHIEDLRTLHPLLRDLTLEKAVQDLGAPMHPGARAFYEERGIL